MIEPDARNESADRRGIRPSGCRRVDVADISFAVRTAVADVLRLRRVVHEGGHRREAARAVALREDDVAAALGKIETRVHVRLRQRAGIVLPGDGLQGFALLSGCEHEQVFVCAERPRGESPFRGIRRIVGEVVTGKVHGGGGRVPNLDPVRRIPVFIEQRAAVVRHELRDQHPISHDRRGGCDRAEQLPRKIRANPREFHFGPASRVVVDEFELRGLFRERDATGVAGRRMRAVVGDNVQSVDAQPRAVVGVDDERVFARSIDDERGGDDDGGVFPDRTTGESTVGSSGYVGCREVPINRAIGKINRRVAILRDLAGDILPADEAHRTLQITLPGIGKGDGRDDLPRGEPG